MAQEQHQAHAHEPWQGQHDPSKPRQPQEESPEAQEGEMPQGVERKREQRR